MYLGYFLYMLDRKAFAFCMPAIMQQLSFGENELGKQFFKKKLINN